MKRLSSLLSHLYSRKVPTIAIGFSIMFFAILASMHCNASYQFDPLPIHLLVTWALTRMLTTAIYTFILQPRFEPRIEPLSAKILFQYAICEFPTLILAPIFFSSFPPNMLHSLSIPLLFLTDAGIFLMSVPITPHIE